MRFGMKIWKDLYGGGLYEEKTRHEGDTHASENGQEF
jgi:hypothetical protein